MSNKIFPKCIEKTRARALTAEGFIVPCCWCDHPSALEEKYLKGLFKSSLNIDNIEDIEKEIINSKEWNTLMDVLQNDPDRAPSMCKHMCGNPVRNAVRDRIRIEDG